MCAASSVERSLKTACSVGERSAGTRDSCRAGLPSSFFFDSGGRMRAAISCGSSSTMSCHCWQGAIQHPKSSPDISTVTLSPILGAQAGGEAAQKLLPFAVANGSKEYAEESLDIPNPLG
jgi:hypothetical protein